MHSDHRNDQEPTVMKWWKLCSRPKADLYTRACLILILAAICFKTTSAAVADWVRVAVLIMALLFAAQLAWRAFRSPPDPPLTH